MNYEQFIAEIQKYWDLRSKGLKKQANNFLFEFIGCFKADVSEDEADVILFQFCREYIDEMKFPGTNLPRRHLPFQMTELLNSYLIRECEKNKMPQMRWAYQLFGEYFNPHDPACEQNPYYILEQAYAHAQCDQQTVALYFGAQVERLWWGQHHFPEGCLITKEDFEDTVHTANKILSENSVDPSLVAEFEHYVKLYHIYFQWRENGRNEDSVKNKFFTREFVPCGNKHRRLRERHEYFYELCNKKEIEFKGIATFYYKK